MNTLSKPSPLTAVGLMRAAGGALALLAGDAGVAPIIVPAIGILHIMAGFFTALYGWLNGQLLYGSKILAVQGLTRLAYGGYLLFAVDSLSGFLMATALYAVFIAFFEGIFSFAASTFARFNPGIMAYSLLNGLASGVFGVMVLMHGVSDGTALYFAAVLMGIAGIFSLLFGRAARGMTVLEAKAKKLRTV